MSRTGKTGWIGVDLDGTLAVYDGWKGCDHIGEPIQEMVNRVRMWISKGERVKIFTARMHGHGKPTPVGDPTKPGGNVRDDFNPESDVTNTPRDVVTPIEDWCLKHLGQKLEITNVKDFGMIELWDDRAIQVVPNTGELSVKSDSQIDMVAATVAERGKIYGNPEESHKNIGLAWTGIIQQHYGINLDHPIPSWLVALMMVQFKAQRAARVFHADNFVDLHAYAEFAHDEQSKVKLS